MALKVWGLVGIPANQEIREVQTEKGYFINFKASSPNPGQDTYYRYNVSVWVPRDRRDAFLETLKSGAIFSIEVARLTMKGKDNKTYPEIRVKFEDFRQLKKPVWYAEETK